MMNFHRIIILFAILLCGISYATEEVYLDLSNTETKVFNTGKLQYENKKTSTEEDENYLKPSFYTLKKMFDEDFLENKGSTIKQ